MIKLWFLMALMSYPNMPAIMYKGYGGYLDKEECESMRILAENEISSYEIGRGNIGHDKDYNFKIVDSSVFDPNWDPEPEYFVDGRWTKNK